MSPDNLPASQNPAPAYGRTAAYLLVCLTAWLCGRPYEGITLDGQLYALQVLAVSQPSPLADDIFLRFGSQNDFTLFPHLVAPFVDLAGIQTVAALATVFSALGLLFAGWHLSRTLSSPQLAWLSVGLLITIPGWYGAANVFRFDEMYLSARVPAEVLSIAALCLGCQGRWRLASVAIAFALGLHAVMAAPALGLLILLAIAERAGQARGLRVAVVVGMTGAVLLALLAGLNAPERTSEYELWMQVLQKRTVYAFLPEWPLQDWLQNLLGLATLALAATVIQARVSRRLAWLSLLIGLLGLALAALPAFDRQFDLLLLAQSWRWTWTGRFVAVVLLPITLATLWKDGATGRACALLLSSGWVLSSYSGGLLAALSYLAWSVRGNLNTRTQVTILWCSYAAATAAMILVLTTAAQALKIDFDTNMAPLWVQRLIDIAGRPGPMAAVIGVTWFALWQLRGTFVTAAVGLLGFVGVVGSVGYTIVAMADQTYGTAQHRHLAPWRAVIPENAEILYYQDPPLVWILLERKSFLSASQSAGVMYSPAATPEFVRRAQSLKAFVDPDWWLRGRRDQGDTPPKELSAAVLRQVCQEPTLGFVVDRKELQGYRLRAEWPSNGQFIYLYDCDEFRQGAGE